MMKKSWILTLGVVLLASTHLGMARHGQYDEEAREAERQEKAAAKKYEAPSPAEAAKNFVGGIKQATVDSAAGLVSDTVDATKNGAPVVGTLEGTREGSSAVLDNTVKGAAKIATLGYGKVDHYEVEDPKAGTDDTTKIKIKF